MRNFKSVMPFLFQLFLTYTILFIIYIIYALLDLEDFDMISEIVFLVFQPIAGFILISITVGICLIAGLPIRLIPAVKGWWLKRPYLLIISTLVGFLLLTLAYYPSLTETTQIELNGEVVNKEIPNTTISVTGWFLTAFSLLHFYPKSMISLFMKIKAKIAPVKMSAVQKDQS